MREALKVNDQEQYFRILARGEVLLPVAADALGATGEAGWGTWTTEGRTHVLAFTSPQAFDICLSGNAGSFRRISFRDLAMTWPNVEWWLAVNPGLPIEGYLPAWFVAQISRGDVRLPGRTLGARARIEQVTGMRSRVAGPADAAAPAPAPAPPAAPVSPRPVGLAAAAAEAPADSRSWSGGRDIPRRGDLLSRRGGFPRRGADAGSPPNGSPDHSAPQYAPDPPAAPPGASPGPPAEPQYAPEPAAALPGPTPYAPDPPATSPG